MRAREEGTSWNTAGSSLTFGFKDLLKRKRLLEEGQKKKKTLRVKMKVGHYGLIHMSGRGVHVPAGCAM